VIHSSTEESLRLLVALSSRNSLGAMIHPSPIYLFDFVRKKPNSFSIGFSFSISAVNYDYFGEGLSFFITPNVLSQTHPSIAKSGIPATFFFLPVAFDTYPIESACVSIYRNNSGIAPFRPLPLEKVSYTPFTHVILLPKIEKSREKSYIILIISVICGVVGLIVVALLI
jgi:hypothetical protein